MRILFVCTANICRSPTAEILSRVAFGEERALFRSAGFLTAGELCPPLLIDALGEAGLDGSQHRSYRLDEASLWAADLILTMEGQHVQKATAMVPEVFPRIMPLIEAARTVASMEVAPSLDALIAGINVRRDPSVYFTTRFDVDDPYGRKLKDYRRAVAEIRGLVGTVIGGVLGAAS